MQDNLEQPPPGGQENITKMSKYKISSDTNPREIFWGMVEAYKKNEGFEKMVFKYSGIREALINIGCTILEEPVKSYRIRIAKAKLAKCIMAMITIGEWEDVMERALANLYSRKKGPELNLLMAFGDSFSKNTELFGKWVKNHLHGERPSEEILAYIGQLGDRKITKELKEELLNIARTEINEPQVYAMEALAVLLPKDLEASKLFVDMMDDWDIETKKIALDTLKRTAVPGAAKKAVALYPYEPEEKYKMALEHILENDKKGGASEISKMFATLDGKEAEEIKKLSKKVYGKKGEKLLLKKPTLKTKKRSGQN